MLNLDYIMIGDPDRFKSKGKRAKNYAQKFRLESDGARKVRSVGLKTADKALARRRAVEYVEERVQRIAEARNPQIRTANGNIQAVVDEYIGWLLNTGNTPKQAELVRFRIEKVIKQAGFEQFAEVDAVKAADAIASLQEAKVFKTTATANRYREALRAWTSWMKQNKRWATNPLEDMPKFKGDMSNSRPRAILSESELTTLLRLVIGQPKRYSLSGEQIYYLYLLSSQTGLRVRELHSLAPANFYLTESPAFVEIRNTISKRGKASGKKDQIQLSDEFAAMLRGWLADKPANELLFGNSRSWFYKAALMLRHDLDAAGLPSSVMTPEGKAEIDFHSFRCLRISALISSGATLAVVKEIARLSSESLVDRYTKISQSEVVATVNSISVPKLLPRGGDPS